MNPENISPNIQPETMPSLPRPNAEYLDKNITDSGIEKTAERVEQVAELQAAVSDVTNTTIQQTIDVSNTENNGIVVDTTVINQNPLLAKDEDLIEREWVDRAKKIVEDTNGDPYIREEQVNKLQADYLNKRYNRNIGLPE